MIDKFEFSEYLSYQDTFIKWFTEEPKISVKYISPNIDIF